MDHLTWFTPSSATALTRQRASILRFASQGRMMFEIRRAGSAFKVVITRPQNPSQPVIEREFDDETRAIDFCNAFARVTHEHDDSIAALDRVSTLMAPRDHARRGPPIRRTYTRFSKTRREIR